jgi:hypothetical protein
VKRPPYSEMERLQGLARPARRRLPRRPPGAEPEESLLRKVMELGPIWGWLAYHTHDSRRSRAGFPDVVLVKPPRVLFVELKAEAGRIRPEQTEWLGALAKCPGVETYVWRPSDFRDIGLVLSGERIPRKEASS